MSLLPFLDSIVILGARERYQALDPSQKTLDGRGLRRKTLRDLIACGNFPALFLEDADLADPAMEDMPSPLQLTLRDLRLDTAGVFHSFSGKRDYPAVFLKPKKAGKTPVSNVPGVVYKAKRRMWRVKANNAMESQALIQLKNNYCTKKLCLQCAIGNHLLKES